MITLKKFLKKLWHEVWVIFLNGLFTLLPIVMTLGLFAFTVKMINSWFRPLCLFIPICFQGIPGSQLLLVLSIIFLTGLVIKLFFLQPLIHTLEEIFFKIPLMRQVYSGIKQIVHAFTVQDEVAFQKVVLIPFPSSKTYSLRFLTGQVPPVIMQSDKRYFNVFVPTTPNPTSGFLVQVPEDELKVIDITRQEAMSLIISGGIIKPERS